MSDVRPSPLPAHVYALLDAAADRYGIPRIYARAVAAQESGGDQSARGTSGELGVMQLMPATARELGVDASDLQQNIDGGVRYLAKMLRLYGERVGLAAYNGGPSIARKPEHDWPRGVKVYLTKVMLRADYEARTIGVRPAVGPFDLADEVTEDLLPPSPLPPGSCSSSTCGAEPDDA
jgi:soluble lytic murein transglycosylase-like protein